MNMIGDKTKPKSAKNNKYLPAKNKTIFMYTSGCQTHRPPSHLIKPIATRG